MEFIDIFIPILICNFGIHLHLSQIARISSFVSVHLICTFRVYCRVNRNSILAPFFLTIGSDWMTKGYRSKRQSLTLHGGQFTFSTQLLIYEMSRWRPVSQRIWTPRGFGLPRSKSASGYGPPLADLNPPSYQTFLLSILFIIFGN